MDTKQLDTVKAVFTWLLYEGKNGFAIGQFRDVDTGKTFVALGNDLPQKKSLLVQMYGEWVINPKDGKKQLKLEYYEIQRQIDREGVIAYICALKCGVGKEKANAIYDHFGEATWDIIKENPMRLSEVRGIGASLAKRVWENSRTKMGLKDVILLFTKANATIPPVLASKFIELHKEHSIKDLEENPYCACEIEGISFEKADAVADYIGFPTDHPERIKAFVTKVLTDAAVRGHVCLPAKELIEIMVNRLEVTEQQCRDALNAVWQQGFIKTTNNMVYTLRSYEEERTIAEEVNRILHSPMDPITEIEPLIDNYEADNFKLADCQRDAVRNVFSSPLSIITGGPGTGKTTVIRAILSVHEAVYGNDSVPVLLAPTGRAARRMTDATGHAAQTIHSAVGYRGMEITADGDAELDGNLIIIDECSMMDQFIASVLFSKCKDGTRVVLVGDPDQLPSVGSGNVLLDLIQSKCVPTTRLNIIFRQAGENPIVANAHAINEGRTNLTWNRTFKELVCSSSEQMCEKAVDFYIKCVNAYGMDNVVLLNPQRNNTTISVDEFNRVLQERLNPHADGKKEICIGRKTFRKGDKVMQLKNTETAKNGDVGYIRDIHTKPSPEDPETLIYESEIEFNGDGHMHIYNMDDMRNIDLAYCSTVHKSQGEEYQTVIMIVSKAHPSMLRRNLVYTGITRSKVNVCIITEANKPNEPSALDIAIRNNSCDKRYTNLIQRLRHNTAQPTQ